MAEKVVFIAFAIEDQAIRDMIKGQSLNTRCQIKFIDMSVKEAYDVEWKKRVRTRILRSNGVLAIATKNSLKSTGQQWEIQCAKDEGVPVRGVWAYKSDRTNIAGVNTMIWSWSNVADWIDSL